MATGPDRELDSIVGAALRALVDSGADRERIGAFAASFRIEVAEILGRPTAAPAQPPDLLQLVRQAMTEVLQGSQGVAAAPARQRKTAVNVLVNGKRTAVSVEPRLLDRLRVHEGSDKQARHRIQEVAQAAPADVSNRSEWVTQRIQALLAPPAPTTGSRH